ncbi:MAG: hypothetical protein IJS82_00390 [Paludibacteraceae bacterium]|nr:hypothetical protein [Paludibacteraceae bacterium]
MRKLLSLFVAALFSVSMFAVDSYTVAGSSTDLFGTSWDPSNTANDLTLTEGTTYQLVKEGVALPATTIDFKICEDHGWTTSYPHENYSLVISESGSYDVTITFDASKGNDGVSAAAVKKGDAVVVPSVAIKGSWSATGAYDDTWNNGAAYNFEIAEDKKTASYTCALTSITDYAFGLEIGGAWRSNEKITIDRDHSSVNFVAGSNNATLKVDLAGEYTFTWTYETETLTVTYPEGEPVVVLPVVALAGTMNDWSATANILTPAEDSLTASVKVNLAAGRDTFKIVSDGKWLSLNGEGDEGLYAFHREWTSVSHVNGVDLRNFEIIADVAGDYTFTWTFADSTLAITFPEKGKFYVTGDSAFLKDAGSASGAWYEQALKADADTLTLSLKGEQEYKLKVLPNGDWKTVLGYDELSEVPAGVTYDNDRNIVFQLAEAGELKIVYFVKEEETTFKLIGNFYVEPEKPTVTLKLVPGEAAADDAKFAVWAWADGQEGYWTPFFTGEGDTLTTQLKQDLDTVIFARFHAQATEPAWGKTGTDTIWDNSSHYGIDYEGLTFTITSMFEGQWEAVKPVPETKELQFVPGVWKEHGAKFAVWAWNNSGLDGAWYAFEGTGDTLSTTIPGAADKAIFVRFNDTVTVYAWADSITWNKTEDLDIQDCGIFFVNDWDNYSWCEAVEPVVPSEEDGFYLIGTLTSWKPLAEYMFAENPGQEGEYFLETTLTEGDEFKVAEQKDKDIADDDWYLSENKVVTAEEAGSVTIYFRPDRQGGEGWIEGTIYIYKAATGVEETAIEGKAVKVLRDGQLFIIKNGVRYNVIGIRF